MKLFSKKETLSDENKQEEDRLNDLRKINSARISMGAAETATRAAAEKFAKPSTYTGNRGLYDSPSAKIRAKKKLFESGKTVVDPYTNETLVLTKREAKRLYKEDWQKHLAESDHTIPLEQIYEDTKGNIWNTTDDIKNAANSEENVRVVSREVNNAKRSRSNFELFDDESYLNEVGIVPTKSGKKQAVYDEKKSKRTFDKDLRKSAKKNIRDTFLDAGREAAVNAGVDAAAMSGIMNLVQVVKGEKSGREAAADTIKDGGKAWATVRVMSGSLAVVSHSLSNSSSAFLKGLAQNNVPGKVVTSIMMTGDTLAKWGKGEITTQECLISLGEKGLNMATMGYSAALGQSMIPIPVIGGAIGALVGSALTGDYYHSLISKLETQELAHRERMRIIKECRAAAEQTKAFREELEIYLQTYLNEYRDFFDVSISSMRFSYETGDADGVIAAANDITRRLGGEVKFETVEEFKSFLDSDEEDVL